MDIEKLRARIEEIEGYYPAIRLTPEEYKALFEVTTIMVWISWLIGKGAANLQMGSLFIFTDPEAELERNLRWLAMSLPDAVPADPDSQD